MKFTQTIKNHYDYLLPILIWIIIFGKNIFSQLMFVDYVPTTYFNSLNNIALSEFTANINPFDLLKLLASFTGLLPYLFQFSILLIMFLSYFYIKRLFKDKPKLFSIIFALVYFFNPFVYSRIMSGQIGVLLAYLMLPACIFYIFEYLHQINKKTSIKLVLCITLSSLFSIHFFIINLIIFIVSSIFIYFYHNKFSIKKYLLFSMIILILAILLNALWLQSLFASKIFSAIDSSHEDFFSPKLSKNIPAVAKIMGMSGFWRENSYNSTFDVFPTYVWFILLALMLILLVTGHYLSNDKTSKIFYSLFWIGLILGTGIAHPYTRPIFNNLFKFLPFFNGFRDSHKLVSLIALAYSYFLAVFAIEIKNRIKKLKFLPTLLIIILIILFSFPLINLNNQIHSVSYPKDYSELNSFFNSKQVNAKIIYLPWQNYLTYNWTINSSPDGRISVPINSLVKQKILIGPDTWGAESSLTLPISQCLKQNNLSCLEQNHVQFIIHDKCSFYQDNFIKNSSLSLAPKAFSNPCLDVYELSTQPFNQPIPLRFTIGIIMSILTLIILIIFLIKL